MQLAQVSRVTIMTTDRCEPAGDWTVAKPTQSKRKIDLPEAVKRMHKALKRETGTPPKPYQPARVRKKRNGKSAD